MPSRSRAVQFIVTGGLNTEQPGGVVVDIESPQVPIPYLTEAKNILFEGNSFRKVGGAIKAFREAPGFDNSNPVRHMALLPTGGQQTNDGDPTELMAILSNRRVKFYYVDGLTPQITGTDTGVLTEIIEPFMPDADGTFTINSDVVVTDWVATPFEDYLVISSSDTTIGVQLLNGPSHPSTATGFSQLDPAEPHFAFSEVYAGRLWAAGDPDNPSRLYYSDLNDPTTGYSTNFIDVDPAGASKITALKTYRDKLFVFKGPEVGAVYVLSGRTPSTFALDIFSKEVGCVGPRAVTEFLDDIMFMDTTGHLRTLATTDKYGDFEGSLITQNIRSRLDAELYRPDLNTANLTNDSTNSRVWVQVPINQNLPLQPQEVTTVSTRASSISYVVDYSSDNRITVCDWTQCSQVINIKAADYDAANLDQTSYLFGISNKYFWLLDVEGQEYIDEYVKLVGPEPTPVYSIVAYKASIELPSIKLFPMFSTNNISKLCVSNKAISKQHRDEAEPFDPNIDITFKWQRDLNDIETIDLSQTFGSRLGDFTYDGSEFILNTSRLGGPLTIEAYAELETTDFRRVTFGFEQSGLNEGMHVHSFAVTIGQDDTGNTENQ